MSIGRKRVLEVIDFFVCENKKWMCTFFQKTELFLQRKKKNIQKEFQVLPETLWEIRRYGYSISRCLNVKMSLKDKLCSFNTFISNIVW